jgi:hypothetical protein
MRRTQFGPWAVSGKTVRSRRAGRHVKRPPAGAGRRKLLRSRVLIAGAVIVVAAVAWVGVQLLRPVPR